MINTILYYKTYILDKQILSPRKDLEVRTAFIKLIEPFLSDYKSVKTYNWISLYLLKLRKPWMHYICLFYIYSFTRIPLISMSIFKNLEPKQVFNQKNSRLYINNYIYNMQIINIFTKKNKVFVAGVNYYI